MKLTKTISAYTLGILIACTPVIPVSAATFPPSTFEVKQAYKSSDAENVQYRRDRNRQGYYNGHRGYRDRRPGYRRNSDGYWYPFAAFGAGAIIGGAIKNQSQRRLNSSQHVQWCMERYKSYRSSDNTYVPRAGLRAACSSPYN
jgi:hypothetical protein